MHTEFQLLILDLEIMVLAYLIYQKCVFYLNNI